MNYTVAMTDDAARDLDELYAHLHLHGPPGAAEGLLDELEAAIEQLSSQPEREAYPADLAALGMREYQEIPVGPFRLIYRVSNDLVYVLVLSDPWRDRQWALQRRLLEA